MIINLNELNTKDVIEFNYKIEKDANLDKRVVDLKNCTCVGAILKDSLNNYTLKCTLKGTMYLNDSITLEPVPYEFACEIEENVEENQETNEIKQNTLDLKRILWQNIVLEVPMSYSLVKDAKLKGNGWELNGDETLDEEIDPRLEKLKDLLKGDD